MKNLKKVLSLALVFAMVLGLCIGAMAANTQDVTTLSDWGNVTHKEAAQLLNAFNIMQGYPDKTYRPTNTVTRAEAVKMIDVGLWGGVDQPDRFVGSEVAFSDVKSGDWYAGHVVYAETLGILDGFPDGTFRPNDTVTGYQMLKMALIALNYSSEVEGLTGAGWDIRTMRLATDPSSGYDGSLTNLTAGLSEITDWNAPLTRDQAAQIIYNMIMHSYISYNLDRNGQVGNIKDYTKGTFGSVYLGLNTVHGVLVANQYGSVTKGFAVDAEKDSYSVNVALKKADYLDATEDTENALIATIDSYSKTDPTATVDRVIKATVSSTIDDLGTPVTVYTKGGYPVAVAIDNKTEVEPAYKATDPTTITNADRELNNTDGECTAADLTVGYGFEKAGDAYKDKDGFTDTTAYDVDGDGRVDFMTTKTYTSPVEVKDITTTNKHGDVYQVNTYGWRSGFENSDLNTKNFLAVDTAGFTAKKGDYIAYNTLVNAYGEVASYGVILDPVAGTINRVNTNATLPSGWYINVDGVQYFLEGYADKKDVPAFGSEGTAYTYPDGKVGIWVDDYVAPTATKYAVIYDAGWYENGQNPAIAGSTITVEVAAILDTGDTGVYKVASITVPKASVHVDGKTSWTLDATTGKAVEDNSITIPTSIFNRDTIVGPKQATMSIKVKDTDTKLKDETINVRGLFVDDGKQNTVTDDGILTNIDNSETTSAHEYAFVSYTVNEDGSLNITPINFTEQVTGDVTANSPTLGNSKTTYFKSSTLTFTQTEQKMNTAKTVVTSETWTVVTGLPTTSYKLNDKAEAYTKVYFAQDENKTDTGAIALVITDGDIAAVKPTMPFLYVVNNNGQTSTSGSDPIYTIDVYNAETNKIEQIEVKGTVGETITAGQFYTNYTAATKDIGAKITLSLTNEGKAKNGVVTEPCVGFISSIQDSVIGLAKVTGYEDTDPNVEGYEKRDITTKPFVVNKDTKYYLVDGENTTQVDADEITTQEVLDWEKEPAGSKNVDGTIRYYLTVIIPTVVTANGKTTETNTAAHVIVFATEQAEHYTKANEVYKG